MAHEGPTKAPADFPGSGLEDLRNQLEHIPELVLSREVRAQVFGAHGIAGANASIAVAATRVLSSMWFFWFCVVLDLAMLPAVVMSNSVIAWVTYISQTVIQLLALPLLGAGQTIIAAAQDARAEADHKTLTALHKMNVRQLEILRRLDELRRDLGPGGAV
jgi:hypothetical protein